MAGAVTFNSCLPLQSNSSTIRAELPMFGVFIEAPASLTFIFLLYFSFLCLIFLFGGFTKINFPDRGRDGFLFGLVIPRPEYSCPQSLLCLPSDLDVVAARFTMSHLLGLDLLSLSTSQKNAFCAALAVLASTSKVPQSKVFISEALSDTSSVFPTLDRSLKYNMEIFSKLDALKRQKTEFDQAQLAKKQATQWLYELYMH